MRPLDPVPDVLAFVRDLPSLRGYRTRVMRHVLRFLWRYHRRLSALQLAAESISAALIAMESFASSPGRFHRRDPRQTYFGPTEVLDPLYRPAMRVAARYEGHFRPTLVTDATGALAEDVAVDLAAPHA
jgi:hopanoid C-2 methylase